jgi:coatomer subunit beta'
LSEAVLFSQTYKPSKTKDLVLEWKESLDKQGKSKVSRLLGVPGQDEELFPEWDEYIKLEQEGGSVEPKTDLIDVDGDEEPATNGTVDDEPAAEDATVEVDA